MCLYVDHDTKAQVATADIDCFKVLKMMGGRWVSPYKLAPYEIGKKMTIPSGQTMRREGGVGGDETRQRVNVGFHTFTTLDDALFEAKDWCGLPQTYGGTDFEEYRVFHATIPKGTRYFVGEFENPGQQPAVCYASRKILVTGEVVL